MILLVSNDTEYLLTRINEFSDSAILINFENYTIDYQVGYTSIIEFPDKTEFIKAIMLASSVVYLPGPTDEKFDFNNPNTSNQGHVEHLLRSIGQTKKITGIDHLLGDDIATEAISKICQLADRRVSDQKQLWAVGDSITAGYGITFEQAWGTILGKKLEFPVSRLAESGSSIEWAADQILRSDIRKDDLIVWGVTTLNRLPYYAPTVGVQHYTSQYSTDKKIRQLLIDDDFMYYKSISHIAQVVNFCNKVECKLLLVGLLSSERDYLYYRNFSNFYQYFNPELQNKFVDLASDNIHPGPKQHALYADAIYHQLELRNWV